MKAVNQAPPPAELCHEHANSYGRGNLCLESGHLTDRRAANPPAWLAQAAQTKKDGTPAPPAEGQCG